MSRNLPDFEYNDNRPDGVGIAMFISLILLVLVVILIVVIL